MQNVLSLKFIDSTFNVGCLVNVSINVNRQSTSHIEASDQTHSCKAQKKQPTQSTLMNRIVIARIRNNVDPRQWAIEKPYYWS